MASTPNALAQVDTGVAMTTSVTLPVAPAIDDSLSDLSSLSEEDLSSSSAELSSVSDSLSDEDSSSFSQHDPFTDEEEEEEEEDEDGSVDAGTDGASYFLGQKVILKDLDDYEKPLLDPNDMGSDDAEYSESGSKSKKNPVRRGSGRARIVRRSVTKERQASQSTHSDLSDADSIEYVELPPTVIKKERSPQKESTVDRSVRTESRASAMAMDCDSEILGLCIKAEATPFRKPRTPIAGSSTHEVSDSKFWDNTMRISPEKGSAGNENTTADSKAPDRDRKTVKKAGRGANDGFYFGARFIAWACLRVGDRSGRSWLSKAAAKGDPSLCRELLMKGADPRAVDHAGYTPLHEAALAGHLEDAALLIQHGADVNAAAENGDTALHDAIDNEHGDVVALLLLHGASVYQENGQSVTPLQLAQTKLPGVIEEWMERAHEVLVLDSTGRTPLHRAAEAGDVVAVRQCLSHGGDVNYKDQKLWTPLHEAALCGAEDCVAELLAYGADANSVGVQADSPLRVAAANGNCAITRLMLRYGADVRLLHSVGELLKHPGIRELLETDPEVWKPYLIAEHLSPAGQLALQRTRSYDAHLESSTSREALELARGSVSPSKEHHSKNEIFANGGFFDNEISERERRKYERIRRETEEASRRHLPGSEVKTAPVFDPCQGGLVRRKTLVAAAAAAAALVLPDDEKSGVAKPAPLGKRKVIKVAPFETAVSSKKSHKKKVPPVSSTQGAPALAGRHASEPADSDGEKAHANSAKRSHKAGAAASTDRKPPLTDRKRERRNSDISPSRLRGTKSRKIGAMAGSVKGKPVPNLNESDLPPRGASKHKRARRLSSPTSSYPGSAHPSDSGSQQESKRPVTKKKKIGKPIVKAKTLGKGTARMSPEAEVPRRSSFSIQSHSDDDETARMHGISLQRRKLSKDESLSPVKLTRDRMRSPNEYSHQQHQTSNRSSSNTPMPFSGLGKRHVPPDSPEGHNGRGRSPPVKRGRRDSGNKGQTSAAIARTVSSPHDTPPPMPSPESMRDISVHAGPIPDPGPVSRRKRSSFGAMSGITGYQRARETGDGVEPASEAPGLPPLESTPGTTTRPPGAIGKPDRSDSSSFREEQIRMEEATRHAEAASAASTAHAAATAVAEEARLQRCLPLYAVHLPAYDPHPSGRYVLDMQLALALGFRTPRDFHAAHPLPTARVANMNEKQALEQCFPLASAVLETMLHTRPESKRWIKRTEQTERGEVGLRFSFYDVHFVPVADAKRVLVDGEGDGIIDLDLDNVD
ncbi:hypothetical protein HKX48_007713 [Thoreauomyces humboldtii]|nr:hypothetical protein HKX48_007713 [Thoreauomyces humboldtii]